MGREKRKGRLNKAGDGAASTGAFIGFGAFAETSSTATMAPSAFAAHDPHSTNGAPQTTASASTASASAYASAGSNNAGSPQTRLSPIYTGSDPALALLFPKVGQKRDATTKSKALLDLIGFFRDGSTPKKTKAEALSHFLYLFQTKLCYDHSSKVRAQSVRLCATAAGECPRAWKNLVVGGHCEILGMLLCARADPASEVRAAASEAVFDNADGGSDRAALAADAGIWGFAQKILSYQKPLDMHADLFQKKGGGGKQKPARANSAAAKLSEAQQEELEERYERIVGTAIEGLRLHLVANHAARKTRPESRVENPSTVKYLWRTLASHKASLRRHTYSLLSTVCQLSRIDLVDSDKLSKLLAQSVSSEKESANLGVLLETLLAFVASCYITRAERSTVLEQRFSRPLSRLFKKGCHGAAPTSSWTPTILPLVALLPKHASDDSGGGLPPRIDLLTNAWEGRTHVVGASDRCEIVRAVAETAAFLLAREEETSENNPCDDGGAFDQILARCWIHALTSYLAGGSSPERGSGKASGSGGGGSLAHRALGTTLAKGWLQLDRASHRAGVDPSKSPPIVYHIGEWFWNEALETAVLAGTTRKANLTHLLAEIRAQQKSGSGGGSTSETPLRSARVLGRKFRSLAPGNNASWVPDRDVYQLWIAILRLVPSLGKEVFSSATMGGSIEGFVANNLLSWAVLHTSRLSDRSGSGLALLDVQLLHGLSVGFPDRFLEWWRPILREILLAQPDLGILTDCLGWLAREGKHCAGDLTTEGGTDAADGPNVFSGFCIETARTVVAQTSSGEKAHHRHSDLDGESESEGSHFDPNEEDDAEHRKTSRFLRACVGLDDQTVPVTLVGERVVDAWVACACPIRGEDDNGDSVNENPVLDTLVAMIRAKKLSGAGESSCRTERVLLQSWRQGGSLWEDECLPWLLQVENSVDRSSLIQNASTESKSCVGKACAGTNDDLAWDWTERAHRLLRLCSNKRGESSSALPSLAIVGLGDVSMWEKGARFDFLSTCLLKLIRRVENVSSRWQLFIDSETDTMDLFVAVLFQLSTGAESPIEADLARRRKDPCAMLLADLGFADFDSDTIMDSIGCCVSKLSRLLEQSTIDQAKICRGIAVLSQLIDTRFASLRPDPMADAAREALDASDVQSGDKIWYVTNTNDPTTQEPCVLVKIHNDLPEEVYFTIRLSRNGEQQERQTVRERLRKVRWTKSDDNKSTKERRTISVDQIGDEEKREREKIVGPILDKLIKSIDSAQPNSYYEIYNIVIVQCGLVSGRGIGSAHYSVVQKLMELQQRLLESLSSNDASAKIASALWHLALALGYGMNAPASEWSIPLTGLNAADSLPLLLAYEEDEGNESTKDMDCAMAAWISVCASACDDIVLRTQAYSTLFELATRLLCYHNGDEYGLNPCHYIALRAIEVGQIESHKAKEGESVIQESEAEALTELTKVFSMVWSSTEEDKCVSTSWNSIPLFDSIIRASLRKRPTLMAIASRQCIDALAKSLYEPIKQRYSMLILQAYAREGRPLFDDVDDDDLINPKTLERLDMWSEDMLESEADELEDDVASVAQWVCKELMNDVESWHDDDDIDDEIACGRMLSWLSVLDITDTATGKDSMNRLAFTSYVSKANAVDAILDLALIYCNVGSERKAEMDIVVPLEEIVECMSLSRLAARVIFRSIEVFPTLSKNWWDSSCPKYLTSTVREFVETQVSPDILNLAVQSIRNAAAFGEMKVKGSPITREVNATYVQDDFTLSVVIKLPLSFPFRRAEVDCSKTLGVPECRWKRWSLQITQMLNNQGGTLKDALLLWKENVDKEFEGVEPCPVCYSVLHVKSHKLPNLECNTCHNQFHSECLFEWFKNSGKSACVICQQPWSGTRIN